MYPSPMRAEPTLRPAGALRVRGARHARHAMAARCACALALSFAAGCGGGGREVTIVDQQRQGADAPRLFGVLALGMTAADVEREVSSRGWTIESPLSADAVSAVVPTAGDPVVRYGLVLEAGKVVQLALDYKDADDARTELRHSYAASKVQPDGAWAMTDTHRQTLVVVRDHGKRLVAIDIAGSRDQVGARAALHKLLGE